MTVTDYPLVNGFLFDWASVELAIDPVDGGIDAPIVGFKSLTYKIERMGAENRYANAGAPVGQNKGKGGYSLSADVLQEAWQILQARLGNGYMFKFVNITASWIEGNNEGRMTARATIKSHEAGWSEDGIPVQKIEFLPSEMTENGYAPFGA